MLTKAQFEKISGLVKSLSGINLRAGKEELVKARLSKRLRQLGMSGFNEYMEYLEADDSGEEITCMLDALSTNVTHFFREAPHFECLARKVLPQIIAQGGTPGRKLRVWSAGCASGEEPYSIAISLWEHVPGLGAWDARILATDISTRMLSISRVGTYSEDGIQGISAEIRRKYFIQAGQGEGCRYAVKNDVRRLVHFARLNLMASWPMNGPFDIIFCRNVMIYFDTETQATLVGRFADLLRSGGFLFVGLSESLANIEHGLTYVQPSVYLKKEA